MKIIFYFPKKKKKNLNFPLKRCKRNLPGLNNSTMTVFRKEYGSSKIRLFASINERIWSIVFPYILLRRKIELHSPLETRTHFNPLYKMFVTTGINISDNDHVGISKHRFYFSAYFIKFKLFCLKQGEKISPKWQHRNRIIILLHLTSALMFII